MIGFFLVVQVVMHFCALPCHWPRLPTPLPTTLLSTHEVTHLAPRSGSGCPMSFPRSLTFSFLSIFPKS